MLSSRLVAREKKAGSFESGLKRAKYVYRLHGREGPNGGGSAANP